MLLGRRWPGMFCGVASHRTGDDFRKCCYMYLDEELSRLESKGLLRSLREMPATGGRFMLDGQECLNFSSNDYLDLANDPRVKRAACEAIERYGCGSTSSRLMSGHLPIHSELESHLAALAGQHAALVFGSGFLTNLGVLTALAGRDSAIYADRLNHASLVDGARLSGAKVHRYRHCDVGHLDSLLTKYPARGARIVVTDSVFSMDGDIAPLAEIHDIARRHGAMLIVDEAHAFGILGPGGGGVCRELGVLPDVTVATLGKSMGSMGGVATGSESMIDFLVNRARPFIYATGLPPASAAAALQALRIIEDDPGAGLRLIDRARLLHHLLGDQGLMLPDCTSQILPVHVGGNDDTLKLSEALRAGGILATAVRPPTVPAGTARLRLSVTLAHRAEDLERAARIVGETARRMGVVA